MMAIGRTDNDVLDFVLQLTIEGGYGTMDVSLTPRYIVFE